MSYLYLLDTNIISELIKNPRGVIFSKIQTVGENTVCTSIIIACELRFGAKKKKSQKLVEKLEVILDSIEILPLGYPVEQYYAEIRTTLEKQGKPIGGNDLLIAAHSLSLGLTLVTANVREFSRVSNLKVENWLESD
ncbi:type II toxin-antitoxin system VapC family toxin [Aetokthonos hydrillicola Thurmond2011]|jgi:tRNA(fMet)-specific endonuclease VapC|uniref:Type II toxin-antitoxin system VapC family toxin n=1 Tax=Aetokthonos hydrillicola Thurmond2011 TaxID=2712845 RepID=A0AAP5MB06_9CYAN|nr:type II toxin-antitoxin system VapC family toxin [Aetokthonos hydrillicola]MBO3463700.1 type II toxin-antitoxin system VapC family toxin [Aetokthonos hydrillicola CCALA 1050]MBW4588594.1 type II toxin-antitoxin system VapC family toxin [Aetokthonos hydrillicola CCALA 1050]MDR9896269.1 type II toxin-antitoxin system VapC family toxin [Aetokthonos hydrillicola Thurmond2011]